MVGRRLFCAWGLASATGACALVAGLEDKSLSDVSPDGASAVEAGALDAGGDSAATSEVIVSGLSRPLALAADPTSLYFSEATGAIKKLRKGERVPVLMASEQYVPSQIVLDAEFVYWRNANSPRVKPNGPEFQAVARMEKVRDADSGAPMGLFRRNANDEEPVRSIALFDPVTGAAEDTMFYTESDRVGRKARSFEGGFNTVVNNQKSPGAIAVGAQHFYWATAGDYSIRRQLKNPMGVDGGPPPGPELVHASPDRVSALELALDDTHVYWLDQLGRVFRRVQDGSAEAELLGTSEATSGGALVVGPARVFWTNTDRGTVTVVPKDGDPAAQRVLATGQKRPTGVALDPFATPPRLYWLTEDTLSTTAVP